MNDFVLDPSNFKLPNGFLSAGISAGLNSSTKKDLGLIICEKEGVLGGVYTQNKYPSAHVQYCKKLTPCNQFRALMVNSGHANAATGKEGCKKNLLLINRLSELLKIVPGQAFTSSTGIIGQQIPLEKICDYIPSLINQCSSDGKDFSEAILTTDTKAKSVGMSFLLGGKKYHIFGCIKGAGMIYPNMATMLAYILTDAPIPEVYIQELIKKIADVSFNCMNVDGDTSTNDSVYLISSNPVQTITVQDKKIIDAALEKIAIYLVKEALLDAEGSNHLIELELIEAPSFQVAKEVVHKVLNSNLVKTAVHGADPNWGRIFMAVGNALPNDLENHPISIQIQSTSVLDKGIAVLFDKKLLSQKMKQKEVKIQINLHAGNTKYIGWGCDLSQEYVSFNSEYTT